jgi:ATP/maltotriose-dependent transcriptional regulator MalT
MGDVYAASGDFANAKQSYEESLAISRDTGERHESAAALANLGSLALQQGDLAGARQNYREAIKLRNDIGEKSGAAEVSLLLASLSLEEGNPSEAEALARQALEEFHAAKITELQISAHAVLAQALLAQGKLNPARKEIATGKPLAAKTQQRLLRLQFEIAAAEVLAASGKPEDFQAATSSLDAVIKEAEKKGIRGPLYEARLALGKAEMQHGHKENGRARLAEVEKDAGS